MIVVTIEATNGQLNKIPLTRHLFAAANYKDCCFVFFKPSGGSDTRML
jgi:hypothetical protein